MKVYDCFTFYNELDLLEIRLKELDSVVDYFVLVEARQTHSGTPKRVYYKENKKRYKKWQKKIIHIIADLPKLNFFDRFLINQSKKGSKIASQIAMSHGRGKWKPERFQRMSIKRGLEKCKNDDIIIVSDIDEIPKPKKILEAIPFAQKGEIVGLELACYFYYLNGFANLNSVATVISSYKTLKEKCRENPQFLRIPYFLKRLKNKLLFKKGYEGNIWRVGWKIIKNGGWHFSYIGDARQVKLKREHSSHAESSSKEFTAENKIKKNIEKGVLSYNGGDGRKIKYIKIDESFPKTIQKNQKKYKNLIKIN